MRRADKHAIRSISVDEYTPEPQAVLQRRQLRGTAFILATLLPPPKHRQAPLRFLRPSGPCPPSSMLRPRGILPTPVHHCRHTMPQPHRRRHGPKPDRRRALELLAASPDGYTEALMFANGFTAELLIGAGARRARARRAHGRRRPDDGGRADEAQPGWVASASGRRD